MIVRDIAGYKLSRDYGALYQLALRQSVICLADYGEDSRDVCQTISDGETVRSVVSRGVCYVFGGRREEFAARCRAANLEWIVPGQEGE